MIDNSLQDTFDQTLEPLISPAGATIDILFRKIQKSGIKLNKRLRDRISELVEQNIGKSRFQIEFDDEQLKELSPSLRKHLKTNIRITQKDIDDYVAKVTNRVSDLVPSLSEKSGEAIYKALKTNKNNEIK